MNDAQYREAAREQHGEDGECEIDDDAIVSRGSDPGAYVQAWVWVPNGAQNEDEVLDAQEGSK